MDPSSISSMLYRAIYIATLITCPILLVCLAVGIIVSIFQAATQIHEQALAFVPKVVAVVVLFAIAGSWISTQIMDFTKEVFSTLSNL